jgi:hypothetical protein
MEENKDGEETIEKKYEKKSIRPLNRSLAYRLTYQYLQRVPRSY